MRIIQHSRRVQIVDFDGEYYVYVSDKLVRVCPSLGMAQEIAAGY